jgi:hypothetical protein
MDARFRDTYVSYLLSTTEISSVSPIRFTQEQVRVLTGASIETVRHWRRTIPYLSEKTGKAARFTFSEVVAMAITHELIRHFGVQITTISGAIDSLFRLLSSAPHQTLEAGIVFVTPERATFCDGGQTLRQAVPNAGWAIPLRPIVNHIQGVVVPTATVESEQALPFAPEIVRSRA